MADCPHLSLIYMLNPRSWEGQYIPSLGQARGAGWAMKVGWCWPGINTEKSDVYEAIVAVCGGPSFSSKCALDCVWPDSKALPAASWGEGKEDLGLNKCSKIAMMRNRDIKIAVATNPKERAFTDAPKFFHGASLSVAGWDGLRLAFEYTLHDFGLPELKSSMALGYNLFVISSQLLMNIHNRTCFWIPQFQNVWEGLEIIGCENTTATIKCRIQTLYFLLRWPHLSLTLMCNQNTLMIA